MEDTMNQSVKEEFSSPSGDKVGISTDNTAENEDDSIPFDDVYSILSNYREKNGGLDIPRTDGAMSRLIPALNKIGFAHLPSQRIPANQSNNDKQSASVSDEPRKAAAAPIKSEVPQEMPAVAPAVTAASIAKATNTGDMAASATKIKGKCDICEQKDGFRGYNLQKCKVCGLTVHERCYGMSLTKSKNLDFVCKACASIGTKVEVNKPSILGTSSRSKEQIRVQERPTECVLCDFHDGIHAMHPLFDTHGPEGRQLVISSKGGNVKRKLAWVHTLCANFICRKTGGSVYGCYGDDGRYEDDSDEEYTNEENEVRFYAMATKENGKETAWSKIITDYRKNIKCSICGKKDNPGSSLRIPLQCCANDVDELVDFKRRHKDRSACFVGMHVGCARWKDDPPTVYGRECKMCYFFDGDDDGLHDDPQLACYCRHHAEGIIANNPKYRQMGNSPSRKVQKVEKKPNSPAVARKRHGTNKAEKRNFDHQASFKRSMTIIGKRGKTEKAEKKRKYGVPPDESQPKRPRNDNDGAQGPSTVFNVQGRSSRILSQTIPPGLKRPMKLEEDGQRQSKRFKSEEN